MTRSLLLLLLLGACDEPERVHVTPLRIGPPAATAELAIAGQVVDDGGAPVPDVHVRVRGDVMREVVSDGGGHFAFTGLFAGTYNVAVLERGIRHVGPASVTVSLPDPTARYLQLVVHRDVRGIGYDHTRSGLARSRPPDLALGKLSDRSGNR